VFSSQEADNSPCRRLASEMIQEARSERRGLNPGVVSQDWAMQKCMGDEIEDKPRCPDCVQCQLCARSRCRACRDNRPEAGEGQLGPFLRYGDYLKWKQRRKADSVCK